MEGSGVANYSTDKPSYAFSTATTEFDDALIDRGIVTHTQAMVAKGACVQEAQRLTQLKDEQNRFKGAEETNPENQQQQQPKEVCSDDDDEFLDDDDEFLDDDDEFMKRYRQDRLAQLQKAGQERKQGLRFGHAVIIDRTEWTRQVNEASKQAWVVVCLTSSDSERTGKMEEAVRSLALEEETTKFVLIPSHHAIPDWPHANLPSLFVYRHGKMQKELVRLPIDISTEELHDLLEPVLKQEQDAGL